MKILMVNLTRFGDLIQSQAAVTDLRRQGHEVAVLCLENFARAAMMLRGVAAVFPFSGSRVLAELDRGWIHGLKGILGFREEVFRNFPADAVCNLTPTTSAQILSSLLIGDGPLWGFGLDSHGFDRNSTPWAAFLEGASAGRRGSPFNLIDVFRQIARDPDGDVARASRDLAAGTASGVRLPLFQPGDSRLDHACNMSERAPRGLECPSFFQGAPDGADGFVAFQLGASQDIRRWPTEYFASLGRILWAEKRLCPVLLGSEAERSLAARYAELADHPHIDLVGKTDLDALAGALCAVSLLVTNDTGTMHLAAGLGTPLLAIFLATAQPFDTGPSLAGSCCLEPDLDCHPCSFSADCPNQQACRRTIKPEIAAGLCLNYLEGGKWTGGADRGKVGETGRLAHPGCRIWQTSFDDYGYIRLNSLSGHGGEDRTIWLEAQRDFLRQFIDRDKAEPLFHPRFAGHGADVADADDGVASSPAGLSLGSRREISAQIKELQAFLHLILTQAELMAVRPTPAVRQKFLGTWSKIHAALNHSQWFANLAPLWAEEAQQADISFTQVLAIIRHYQALLDGLAGFMHV